MNMKSILVLSAGVTLAIPLVAEPVYEGYWETPSCREWWNPNGWRDGKIPGRYSTNSVDGTNTRIEEGNYGATAYFGTQSDWLLTVIDFSKQNCQLLSISNLVFTGNKFPEIGQAATHSLYLEDGGGIYVRDTCTKAPKINCTIYIENVPTSAPLTFWNDAADATMTLAFGIGKDKFSLYKKWNVVTPLVFGGKGSVSFGGSINSYMKWWHYLDARMRFTAPGQLTLTGKCSGIRALVAEAGYGKQTLEIAENASCQVGDGSWNSTQIEANVDLDIVGAGTFNVQASTADQLGRIVVKPGCTLNIATAFDCATAGCGWQLYGDAGGVMKMTGVNKVAGPATIRAATFEVSALGNAGEASPFGLGDKVVLGNGGTIRYVGEGEETDRTISIAANDRGVLEQRGTGVPVFAGPVSAAATSTLVLSNETAVAAELSGNLAAGSGAVKVEKVGVGEWVLSGATMTVGDTTVKGGTLTVVHPEGLTASKLTVSKSGTLALGGVEAPEARPESLTVYGAGAVKAKWPTAVPIAGVTMPDGAALAAILPNWTWAEILDYANAHPQTGWAAIAVDTSALADGTEFELANADVTAAEGFALGHAGDNTMNLKVTEPVENPVALVVSEGTLRVSGEGSLALSKALATSAGAADCGKLVFDGLEGGATLTNLMIGSVSETTGGGCGEVEVTDMTIADAAVPGKTYVGSYGQGLLKIGEGADWRVKTVSVGSGDSTDKVPGEGTVLQTAGLFDASTGLNLGSHGVGCYMISGGKMIAGQTSGSLGGYEGQGILVQSGGEVETPAGEYVTLGSYGGFVAYQTGGTCTFGSRTYLTSSGNGSANFSSAYTVAGEDAITTISNEKLYMGNGQRTTSSGPMKAILNLNGGVFRAVAVGRYPYTDRETTDARQSRSYVNFNGGTLQTTSTAPLGASYGYPTVPNRVTVFAGGATLCVSNNNATLPISLSAPFGNSVVSVPVPTEIADRDFVASPYVEIFDVEGEGDGATAYAEVDLSTRRISDVIVTSPGWNYTRAVARFYVGKKLLAESDCGLGAVASGGFTKDGPMSLTLNATNTYAGATVVKAGTLKLGLAEALPSNTEVRVEGGMLDLNGFEVPLSRVSVTGGGTIANGSVTLPGITYDIADPQTVSCDCAVTFAQGAKVTIRNVDRLDPDVKSYVVARFTGDVTNMPTEVEGLTEDVLKDWHVTITPNRIRLSKNSGALLMVR